MRDEMTKRQKSTTYHLWQDHENYESDAIRTSGADPGPVTSMRQGLSHLVAMPPPVCPNSAQVVVPRWCRNRFGLFKRHSSTWTPGFSSHIDCSTILPQIMACQPLTKGGMPLPHLGGGREPDDLANGTVPQFGTLDFVVGFLRRPGSGVSPVFESKAPKRRQ